MNLRSVFLAIATVISFGSASTGHFSFAFGSETGNSQTAVVVAQNEDMEFQILYIKKGTDIEFSSIAPEYALNLCYVGDVEQVGQILESLAANEFGISAVQLNYEVKKDRKGNARVEMKAQISDDGGLQSFQWIILRCKGA